MYTLSLKWKALGALSVVLLGIIAGITWLSYTNLREQFEETLGAEEARYGPQIHALLRQIDLRLSRLSGWLPALEGMAKALEQHDPQALSRLLDRYWPSAQLDYDLQSAAFYGYDGSLIGHWNDGSREPEVPQAWIDQVNLDERPFFALSCRKQCSQVAVLPLLVDNRTLGTLVLTTSVAELILRFREVTGRDLGILIRSNGQASVESGLNRSLTAWGLDVVAMSQAPKRIPLLRRVAGAFPFPGTRRRRMEFDLDDRTYAMHLFPLRDFTPTGQGFFIVLADNTDAVTRIRAGALHVVQVGALGVLLSELVLFLVLSNPLTRLHRVAKQLPGLARKQYRQVREALTRMRRRPLLADEIDHLEGTALDLAQQLETLSEDVRRGTEALQEQMHQLDHERSFVNSLLNTVQVVILTQDRHGQITLANRYAAALLGISQAELVGKPFHELLNPMRAGDCESKLQRLRRGEYPTYSHEAEVFCTSGQRIQVVWFHSLIENPEPGDSAAAVMSAGLDITHRKQAEERVTWLADHDPLTRLMNRRRFEIELKSAVADAMADPDAHGALLYLDLDQFKYLNDTRGHPVGDRVLEHFSGNLEGLAEEITRGTPLRVARLGGDEFGVIVPGVDAQAALKVAEHFREGLSRFEYPVGTDRVRLSCSIGIALFPEHGIGFQELMQNADLAMYQAKRLGVGRVRLFDGGRTMRKEMANQMHWKERIDAALEQDRLCCQYQPIVATETGELVYYEALVRMRDQDGELISPGMFIPVAEATGQIIAVDCRVLELVFAAWERFQAAGVDVGLHVNLSTRAFQTEEWRDTFHRLLDQGRVDPSRLVLEITETEAVTDMKEARQLMEEVHERGCQFALDDFGVGFSSFNYLRQLPVDMVKIDGAFIRQLYAQEENQYVVKAMVDVAHGFGKVAVAEFVDCAQTFAMLKEFGVDYAQGYYLGKPLDEAQILAGAAPRMHG